MQCPQVARWFLSLALTSSLLVSGGFGKSHRPTMGTVTEMNSRSEALYKVWTGIYGLQPEALLPPPEIKRPPRVNGAFLPLAPHLDNCARLAKIQADVETFMPNGSLPMWWQNTTLRVGPAPPWVRGCVRTNLPFTRRAQADIWLHQNPATCQDPTLKFLLVPWPASQSHGVGSAIHLMTSALSLAMTHGRILVVEPKTFSRADHDGCTGSDRNNWDCYFAPLTTPACVTQAMGLVESSGTRFGPMDVEQGQKAIASDAPLVALEEGFSEKLPFESSAASIWGSPWVKSPVMVDIFGVTQDEQDASNRTTQTSWWRAQAVRYMLRWPTPYLCHLTNRARHLAFGPDAANRIAAAELGQTRAAQKAYDENQKGDFESLQKVDLETNPLEVALWADLEPYVNRPIVSVHVRQADGAKEMKTFSLAAHMWLAEKLRFQVPNMKHIWLSTAMQPVINELKEYPDWRVMYTENPRVTTNKPMVEFEQEVGYKNLLETSLVNLVISAQCDYFVGTLKSHWNRLINELRLTNGRVNAGFIALNFGEW